MLVWPVVTKLQSNPRVRQSHRLHKERNHNCISLTCNYICVIIIFLIRKFGIKKSCSNVWFDNLKQKMGNESSEIKTKLCIWSYTVNIPYRVNVHVLKLLLCDIRNYDVDVHKTEMTEIVETSVQWYLFLLHATCTLVQAQTNACAVIKHAYYGLRNQKYNIYYCIDKPWRHISNTTFSESLTLNLIL